ncbi:hypothetical protein Cus16_1474 [Curtobacterium sp. ER1/6]|nr:hypothetical protein Cus16_1474 [Curtobacterium sp. ER1/6]
MLWCCCGRGSALLGELLEGVVALVRLDRVLLGDEDRRQLDGRDDLLAVVVVLVVRGLRGLAVGEVRHQVDGGLGLLGGVLVDGRVLLALHDQRDRRGLGVLTGDDRVRLAGRLGGGQDRAGQGVVRRQDAVELGVRVRLRQDVGHARLGVLREPTLRVGVREAGATRDDLERAVVDLRLEHVHGAVEEDLRVGVVGRAGEELDVVRAVRLLGLESVEQGLALQLADLEVVERDVVVDVLGVQDVAVPGDDDGAGLLGGLHLRAELRTVGGTDDDRLRALGDHRLDLALLVRDRVAGVGVLDVGLEAGVLDRLLERGAREHPVLRGLGGERDADQVALLDLDVRGAAGRAGAGVRVAAGRAAAEGQARDECQTDAGDELLAHEIAFSSLRSGAVWCGDRAGGHRGGHPPRVTGR